MAKAPATGPLAFGQGAGIALAISGLHPTIRAVNRLPLSIRGKIVRPALRAGAKVILEETKRQAPVLKRARKSRKVVIGGRGRALAARKRPRRSPLPVPGLLRRSLRVRAMKSSKRRIGYLTQTSNARNLFTGRAYYGAFLEFGSGRGRTPKKPKLNRHSGRGRSAWRNYVGRVRHHRASAYRIEPMHYMDRAYRKSKNVAYARVLAEMRRLFPVAVADAKAARAAKAAEDAA